MAYAVHFRFQWRTDNDNIYRIDILGDGYSGDIVQRPLGGAPQLRRNRSGAICGTSLEFQAQALVDGEFATLYTTDAQGFRVDLYQNSSLIWQGYITPELYSEPYVAPPYNVRVTATDNLGELKLSDYTPQGRVSVADLIEGILEHTGLDYDVHWLSALHPSDPTDIGAEDMASATTVNLDHMAGQTLYDVLQKVLDTFHAFIVQQGCSWIIVRETDLEYLRSGSVITAPDGGTFAVGDFGSMTSEVWWPVGYLSQTIQPAKRQKVLAAPNNWIRNLLPATATSVTRGEYVEPDNGDSPYYELTPYDGSLQYSQASLNFWSGFAEMVPPCDLSLSLAVATFGTLLGHHFGGRCAEVEVMVVGSDGSSYIMCWVDPEGNLVNTATPALTIDGIYRETPERFTIPVPIQSQMQAMGYTKVYQIQVSITSTDVDDTVTRMRIYDWALNAPEQNRGFQVTCELNNGARGAAELTEVAVADNIDKAYETVLITNGLKYTAGGASIEEWASGNIPSMPLLEFLARDYCLSIATPRLRMEGILNVPNATPLPLLYRGGGLIYWPETWDWNLYEDRLDVSMVSLPAAAIQVTSVTRQAQGSGGFVGGYTSGGGAGGGANFFELDGDGNVKLKDEYNGLWAAGFISAGGLNPGGGGGGGVDMLRVWQDLTNDSTLSTYDSTTKIHIDHIPLLGIWRNLADNDELPSYDASTKIALSHIPDITTAKVSNLGTWPGSANITTLGTVTTGVWHGSTIPVNHGGTGLTSLGEVYSLVIVSSSGGFGFVSPNWTTGKRYLTQMGNGSGFQANSPVWSTLSLADFIGSSAIGSASLPVYYTGSGLQACTKGDLFSELSSGSTTNLSVTVSGQTRSITNLYAKYDGLGNVISSTYLSSNTLASWTGSTNIRTVGTLDSLTVSGATTINGATVINNTLQVGNPTTNRNMQLYGELHFNGSPSAYINYVASTGIHSSVTFNADSDLTVYGTTTLSGATTINGATVINNTLQVGNASTNHNMQLYGELHFNGLSNVYFNYIAANSGIHCSTGFYSDSYISAGGVSSSSDERLKKDIKPVGLSLDQIANAPAVEFSWLLREGKSCGSIAQYWEKVLPYNVQEVCGHKTMEYGNIALVSAIILARKVRELEQELVKIKGRMAA